MLKCRSFAVGLLILWWGGIVYAADMDFEVNTGIAYDSNVLRSDSSPEEDVYFTLSPKAALTLAFYRAAFNLSSRAAWKRYINRADANLQELTFSGFGRYNPSDYWSFGLQEELIVSEQLSSAERLTDVIERRKFVENRFASDVERGLREEILEVSLGYANIIRNYRHTENDNWASHTGRLQVEYFFGYKTSTQMSFGLTRKVYEAGGDYSRVPVTASLRREITDEIDATLSFGLDNRRYDEPYESRNWTEPSVSLVFTGEFTLKTASRLGLQRRIYDSDFAIGYAFVSKAADIGLFLNPSDSVQLTLQGIYSRNGYINFKRTDSFMEGRGEVRYRLLRWGAIALSYGYGNRISSIPLFDYQQHLAGLSYVVIF